MNGVQDFVENVEYTPSQEAALGYTIWDDELLAIYMFGGVRGGKSFLACKVAQAVAHMYPGSEILICRDTRVNIRETTQQTFFGFDANGEPVTCRDFYDMRTGWNETKGELRFHNGSRICFWGLDTAEHIDRVKSTQWSLIIVEEANGVRFDIIEFLLYTRLSHPIGVGKMLLISNTDKGEDRLYKMFFREHTCSPDTAKECKTCGGACQFRKVHVSTLDNAKNLPEKYMKNILKMAETRPEYARIYVQGEHVVMEGLIYPMYEERYNVIDFPPGYEFADTVETVYGYDHGFGGSPSCLLEAKVFHDGTIVFWNEWYFENKDGKNWTVRSMSADMKAAGINHVHCADPSIRNKNQNDGERVTSIQQLYSENGVQMDLADNDVDGRIERTRDLMERDPEHTCPIPGVTMEGVENTPKFFIARVGGKLRCPNLHSQIMARVNKKDAKGKVAGKKYQPEDGNDHALDPAEYIVNARYKGRLEKEPEPEQGTAAWAHQKAIQKMLRERARTHGSHDGLQPVSDRI
jgi:PBSX family phage terminase large subunit